MTTTENKQLKRQLWPAVARWRWTEYNPKSAAEDRRELIAPDGTLAGVTIRTLVNGWGQYQDRKRADLAKRILDALNGL